MRNGRKGVISDKIKVNKTYKLNQIRNIKQNKVNKKKIKTQQTHLR